MIALALTACSTTANHLATNNAPVRVVEKATMPPIPSALLVKPNRPEPPISGSREDVLRHAVDFGAYVKILEIQLDGWIDWATGAAK